MVALVKGSKALMMELNSETDFAAREPEFLKACRNIAEAILSSPTSPKTKEEVLGMKKKY
jgi:translation elongation factor EF-Ts